MEKRHASASIPKKPLAVSKTKKKLPMELDWGEGIPKDRLRYINADEEALIKRFRTSRSARDYAGIPAYADDSASSKGVSRGSGTTTGTTTTKSSTGSGSPSGQGGQSRGPSGAGQGPNSPSSSSSRSSSPSSSPGGGYKGQSAASVGVSNAPNAAAQAASNAYRSPQVNTSGGSPNMAASYASQKLNATSNALRSAQQPQSIQGMINSGVATPWGGQQKAPTQSAAGAEEMVRRDFVNNQLGNLTRDPAISKSITNALGNAMWNTRVADATRLAQGEPTLGNFGEVVPQQGNAAGFRTLKQQLDIMKNGASKVKDPARSYHTWGLAVDVMPPLGPGESITDPAFGERTYQVNKELQANMDDPAVTWGGNWNFVDPGHFQYGSGPANVAAATYGTPISVAGTRPAGAPAPTTFAAAKPPAGVVGLKEALDSWNPPKYTGVPEPTGQTVASTVPQMQNYPQTPNFGQPIPSSGVVSSPLGPVQPPAAPTRSPTMALSNPFGSYNPVAAGRMASLQTRLGVDDALSSGSVQTASNDAPTPVFSDNPVQGSQNPMQDEGENPQVKRDRQIKYANRGATIGGVIAGPIGTVVGATLGWQMGKTSPQQRQAIASNPQALQANVQSINEMVDQRGGKGNPNLKVTEVGLKDVLENPQKVTANPQAYTSLEQSLASLAQGIDPETGQAI